MHYRGSRLLEAVYRALLKRLAYCPSIRIAVLLFAALTMLAACRTPPAINVGAEYNERNAIALRANLEIVARLLTSYHRAVADSLIADEITQRRRELNEVFQSAPSADTNWDTVFSGTSLDSRWQATKAAKAASLLDDADAVRFGWLYTAITNPTFTPAEAYTVFTRLSQGTPEANIAALANIDRRSQVAQQLTADTELVIKSLVEALGEQARQAELYASKLAAYSQSKTEFGRTAHAIFASDESQGILDRILTNEISDPDRRQSVKDTLTALVNAATNP